MYLVTRWVCLVYQWDSTVHGVKSPELVTLLCQWTSRVQLVIQWSCSVPISHGMSAMMARLLLRVFKWQWLQATVVPIDCGCSLFWWYECSSACMSGYVWILCGSIWSILRKTHPAVHLCTGLSDVRQTCKSFIRESTIISTHVRITEGHPDKSWLTGRQMNGNTEHRYMWNQICK